MAGSSGRLPQGLGSGVGWLVDGGSSEPRPAGLGSRCWAVIGFGIGPVGCGAVGGGMWAWGSGVGWESIWAAVITAVISGVFPVGSIKFPSNHTVVRMAMSYIRRRLVSVSGVGVCNWSVPWWKRRAVLRRLWPPRAYMVAGRASISVATVYCVGFAGAWAWRTPFGLCVD